MIVLESPGLPPLDIDNHAEGWMVEGIEASAPEVRPNVTVRPGVDGTIDRTERVGARVVTVHVKATRWATQRLPIRRLLDMLAPYCVPSRRLTLTLTDPDTSDRRTIKVRPAGDMPTKWTSMDVMDLPVSFVTDGSPYWKGRERVTSLALSPDEGAPGIAFPVTFPLSFPDAPPGEDSGKIRNNGTVDATWRTVVEGPATAIRLDNLTHQTSLQLFPIGIGAGEKMILDSYERSVVIGGERRFDVAVLSQFSDWWQLPPGENQLRMVVAGSGSPAQVSFAWADAFYL